MIRGQITTEALLCAVEPDVAEPRYIQIGTVDTALHTLRKTITADIPAA